MDEKMGGKKEAAATTSALRSPTTWQLAFTVCAVLLLALVGMIVYMEGLIDSLFFLLKNVSLNVLFGHSLHAHQGVTRTRQGFVSD